MADASVVEAITAATLNNKALQQAMLLGSWMESTWTATSVGDHGTSFGPFQIHLPAHPGVTAAEAENPAWATNYMLPVYQAALTQNSDPMMAAALTAFHAERPAQMYPSSRISAGWAAVQNAMNATGANSPSGGNSALPWPFSAISDQIGQVVPFFTGAETFVSKLNEIMTKIFLASTWVRVMAFSVGVILTLVGLFLFFTKPRTVVNTVEGVGRTVASMVP